MTPHESEKLERLIQSVVNDLPARPAPRSLESRVLAEIERRARLPWYRRSFAHWPLAMRGVFLVFSATAAAATFVALVPASVSLAPASVQTSLAEGAAILAGVSGTAQALGRSVITLFSSIPPLWLYVGAAVVAACYAALMALGTAAYRTLRVQSS